MELADRILNKIIQTGVAVEDGLDSFIKSEKMSELMTINFPILKKENTVREALSIMVEKSVSCVVIEENAIPVGILIEKDISRIVLDGKDISALRTEDVMSSPAFTIDFDSTEYNAFKIMSKNKVRRLVVVDEDGQIAGLVTHSYLGRGLERGNVQALKDAIMEREGKLIKTEEELKDKNVFLENIIRFSSEIAMVAADPEFHINYFNPAAEKLFGLKSDTVIGKSVMEVHALKNVAQSRFDQAKEILTLKGEYEFSTRLNIDSVSKLITSKITVIKNAEDRIVGYAFFSRDRTDRIQLEDALLDEGRAYRSLFEDSPIPLCEENWAGVKKYINRLKVAGITDFRKYFTINPKATVECVSAMKIVDINKAALDLFGADSKDELQDDLKKILFEKTYWVFMKAIIAFAEGETKFESETVNRSMKGKKNNVSMKWVIPPGYEETFSKVLVSIVDITEHKKNVEELVKERKKARDYLDIAEVLIVAFNVEGKVTLINRKGCMILGVEEHEVIGKSWFDIFVSERDREKSRDSFNKFMIGNDPSPGHCESILINKQYGERIVEWNNNLLRDEEGGIIGTLCSGKDITERKIAEQQIKGALDENDLLLKEIHHRVKNNLQIICSLFNLQKDSIKDRETYEMVSECQNRIRAIALVHDKLYRSESLANIDLKEYVGELLNNLFGYYEINPDRITLKTDIDDILIGINSAIPCGLIINELVSNSLQYAFPSEKKGGINVSIRLTDVDEIDIIVSHDGIGHPENYDSERYQPLGMQIVNSLIKQLDGIFNIVRHGGTKFIIKFRLKK